MVTMPPRHGKQVAHSVDVLTSNGWKKHGDLCKGDRVFGPDGQPTDVLGVSPPSNEKMLVTFSDGTSVKTHPNHEWVVFHRGRNRWVTLETKGLASRSLGEGRCNYQLPLVTGPMQYPEKDLPIDPYFLGAWLGDGTAAKAELCWPDDGCEVVEELRRRGITPSSQQKHKDTGVNYGYFGGTGLIGKLRKLNLIRNKRIPLYYLFSSVAQRLDLLAGLIDIDTDGHVCKKTGRVRIVTCDVPLRDGYIALIRSLGWRPYVTEQEPTLSSGGIQGRRTVYTVGFQPTSGIPTKIARKEIKRFAPTRRLGIVSVVPCASEPGKCIEVDRADGLYLITKNLIPTHNSTTTSEWFPLWVLDQNPYARVVLASYGAKFASGWGDKVRNLADEHSEFISFTRPKGGAAHEWATGQGVGSMVTAGVDGTLTGYGADVLIIDDPVKNSAEAHSEVIREKTWEWYRGTAYSRLEPGGIIVVVMTRWDEDDLGGRILAQAKAALEEDAEDFDGFDDEQWEVINMPAIAEENDPLGRKEGEALWPERYSERRLKKIKKVVGPYIWASLYQQHPTPADGDTFNRSWFRYYKKIAGGKVFRFFDGNHVERLVPIDRLRKFCTVDVATSTKETADYFVIAAWGLDKENNLFLLDLLRERIPGPGQVPAMREMSEKFNFIPIGIEKVAYQLSLIQNAVAAGLPAVGMPVDGDKVSRAQLFAARMAAGAVFWLADAPYTEEWEKEYLSFPGGKNDDQVDVGSIAAYAVATGSLLKRRKIGTMKLDESLKRASRHVR